MIRRPQPIVAVVLLAVGVCGSACSSPTSPSGPAAIADRIGGIWTLAAQQPVGQTETAPPGGATFRMEIAADRAAITADCNRCNGPAAVGEHTVTVGPLLACTRAFCASAPFDHTFLQLLAGQSEAMVSGNTLFLHSDRGVLRFRR